MPEAGSVDAMLNAHERRLDVHKGQIYELERRLSLYESKIDNVKSDYETELDGLHKRLGTATELAVKAIDLTERLAKLVAELQGEVHGTT